MSSVFRLALGLAAVDGLASAFVATLMLAFFVIGSGEQSAAVDFASSEVLLIKKSIASEPMRLQLLVNLRSGPDSSYTVIVPTPGSTGLMPVSDTVEFAKDGGVYWYDCRSELQSCESQLVVTKPSRGKCWQVRISVASTPQSFAETFPGAIDIEATLMPLGRNTSPFKLLVDGQSWLDLRVHCGPEVLKVGGP